MPARLKARSNAAMALALVGYHCPYLTFVL
jgi:hypothetical protein